MYMRPLARAARLARASKASPHRGRPEVERPHLAARELQLRVNEELRTSRDPVSGAPIPVQPTEEQAPGLRGLLVGVLQAAGSEGVPVARFWEHYRRHYAGYAHPSYFKSRPLEGSKEKRGKPDLVFRVCEQKPDRTLSMLLRSYDTSLLTLLRSLAHVSVTLGGREGPRVSLKPEYLEGGSAKEEAGAGRGDG